MLQYIFILGLAVLTCVAGDYLSYYKALDFFSLLLAMIAGVYIGFAIEDGRRNRLLIEGLVALGFVVLVLLSLWRWPILLPVGYFLHGVWDLMHHPFRFGARTRKWYPPACMFYDWLVGAFIYITMF